MKPFRDWSIRWKVGLHLLVILLLILAHLGGIWWFIQEQEHDGTAINEAGEQRMLSQMMALNAHQIAMGDDEKRDELASSAAEYDRTLTALIEGNESMGIPPAPPDVREQLLVVQAEWEPYYAHVQTLVEEPRTSQEFDESLAYVEANNEQLLVESDRAVERYERVYEGNIQRIQRFFLGLLVLDLFVIPMLLVLINRHIIRPVNRMTDDAETIASGDHESPITDVDSDDEIGRLSRSLQEMNAQLVSAIREIERFEQAVEHAGHAVYITDREGTIEYVNPAFERITKYSEAQAIGETPRILKSGQQPESYYEEMWETIQSGESWEEEIVNRRASGERFHAYQTIAPITDRGGDIVGFVAIMADNTEQLVSTQQNQVLGRVLRHNLRTELNLIDGFAQEITNADDDETRTAYADKIRARIDSLVELSAKSDRCARATQEESYRQPQGVRSAIDRVSARMDERYPHATITVDTPEYEIDVLANVEIVLEELVENAIEHNDSAAPEVTITVTLREETEPPPTVRIDVADNGPGIPSEERLVLEKGEETPLFHGSGLGLWLVHWFVTLAGGKVTIETRSPRGTCVSMFIPRGSVRAFPNGSVAEETAAIQSDTDTTDTHD